MGGSILCGLFKKKCPQTSNSFPPPPSLLLFFREHRGLRCSVVVHGSTFTTICVVVAVCGKKVTTCLECLRCSFVACFLLSLFFWGWGGGKESGSQKKVEEDGSTCVKARRFSTPFLPSGRERERERTTHIALAQTGLDVADIASGATDAQGIGRMGLLGGGGRGALVWSGYLVRWKILPVDKVKRYSKYKYLM